MINLGNIELSKIYLGNTEIQKAYLGTEQIYPAAQPTIIPIQIVKNGNFADDLTSWREHTFCDASIQDGFIRITKNAKGSYGAILYQNPTWAGLATSHKYYQKGVMRQGTVTAYAGFCANNYTVGSNTQLNTDSTSWVTLDQITSPKATSNYICLRAGASASAAGVYAEFKSFMAIDLTATFGAGNEPTLAECRRLFPNDYYDYYIPS